MHNFSKYVLHQVHDTLGHNGIARNCWSLKWLYCWKGLHYDIDIHVKQWTNCRQQNQHPQYNAQLHLGVPMMPMYFIVIDLTSTFKLLPQGHQSALTVIDMLMNYTWCIWLFTEESDKVVHARLINMYSRFGGSHKILSDSGTEFNNKLFAKAASTLGMKQVFSSPYYPWSNGYIENSHSFLKMCMQEHVSSKLVLDEVFHIACAAYNFIPNEHSKNSLLSLCLGEMHIHY